MIRHIKCPAAAIMRGRAFFVFSFSRPVCPVKAALSATGQVHFRGYTQSKPASLMILAMALLIAPKRHVFYASSSLNFSLSSILMTLAGLPTATA